VSPPTCQKCGGDIAGWLCQNCPAEFRENDDGVLIFDVEAPAEAGEREAWKWIATLYPNDAPSDLAYDASEMVDAFMAGRSSALRTQPQAREEAQPVGVVDGLIGRLNTAELDDGTPLYTHPAPDALRAAESLASYRDTIGAQPQARPWGWDYEICTGCSASLTMADIKASGKVSCCPDRRMVTVRELVDAYEARRVAVVALTAAMRVMTRIAATSSANLDQAITNIGEMREAALHGADAAAQALAALQAEQRAK